MKNISIIFILFSSLVYPFGVLRVEDSFAQEADSHTHKKFEIGLCGGYDLPLHGGNFTKYYNGMLMGELMLGYNINPSYSIHLDFNYGNFMLKNISQYVTDIKDGVVADVYAPPYTDLVGGGIQVIGFNASVLKIFNPDAKLQFGAFAGPSFALLEKSLVDGTDSTDTYQILEHYVHDKPFGINLGARANYHLSSSFMLHAVIKYNGYFTSQVVDKAIGTLAVHVGVAMMF